MRQSISQRTHYRAMTILRQVDRLWNACASQNSKFSATHLQRSLRADLCKSKKISHSLAEYKTSQTVYKSGRVQTAFLYTRNLSGPSSLLRSNLTRQERSKKAFVEIDNLIVCKPVMNNFLSSALKSKISNRLSRQRLTRNLRLRGWFLLQLKDAKNGTI